MSIELIASGTTSVNNTSVHVLNLYTVPAGGGAYIFEVDASSLQASENLTLRSWRFLNATENVVYNRQVGTYGISTPIRQLPIMVAEEDNQISFTLLAATSGSRSFPWAVKKVGNAELIATGSTTCTVGSWSSVYTINPPADGGVYILSTGFLDSMTFGVGEAFSVQLETKVHGSSATNVLETATFVPRIVSGSVSEGIKDSPPITLHKDSVLNVSIKQLNGSTERVVPWCIYKVG